MGNNDFKLRTVMKIGKFSFGTGLPLQYLKKLKINHRDILKVTIDNNKIILEKCSKEDFSKKRKKVSV